MYPQSDSSGLRKPKRIGINTTHGYPKPVLTDLKIKSNLVLTDPTGKDGVRDWSMAIP